MPGLILWKNQEISRLKRDMDRLFARLWDDFGVPLFPRIREAPFMDLSETEDALIIRAELHGIDPEGLEVSITDDALTLKGEMKEEVITEDGDYHRRERRSGLFSRTIQLPCRIEVEAVEATYKKGILSIVMPKAKCYKGREIRIRVL